MILTQGQDSATSLQTPQLTEKVFIEHLNYYRLSTVPGTMGDADDVV